MDCGNSRRSAGCKNSRLGYNWPDAGYPIGAGRTDMKGKLSKAVFHSSRFCRFTAALDAVSDVRGVGRHLQLPGPADKIVEYLSSYRAGSLTDKDPAQKLIVDDRVEWQVRFIARPPVAFHPFGDGRHTFRPRSLLDQTAHDHASPAIQNREFIA